MSFFNENESVTHLFFSCCVAYNMWNAISEIVDIPLVRDFESLGRIWLKGKQFSAYNVLTTAVIWAIWKMRNNLCFQGVYWSKMEVLFYLCAKLIRRWALLSKQENSEKLELWASELERRSTRPPRLAGVPVSGSSKPESNKQMTDDRSEGNRVRGVSLQDADVSLLSEQVMCGGNVPGVRATTVNFASE
jgi:hypothetical protein